MNLRLKLKRYQLLAIIIWGLSFVLSLAMQPSCRYIWLTDALLLFGFWPLLIGARARWLWIVFGVGDMIIGFLLAMSTVLPETNFGSYNSAAIKKHLEICHPFLTWMLIGFLSAIIGVILIAIRFMLWLIKKLPLIIDR